MSARRWLKGGRALGCGGWAIYSVEADAVGRGAHAMVARTTTQTCGNENPKAPRFYITGWRGVCAAEWPLLRGHRLQFGSRILTLGRMQESASEVRKIFLYRRAVILDHSACGQLRLNHTTLGCPLHENSKRS